MRPGALHIVYSSEPTVVRGGHGYSYFSMEDTVEGLYHTLGSWSRCTNELNLVNLKVLRRMMGALHSILCQDIDDTPPDLTVKAVLGKQDSWLLCWLLY